MILADFSVYYIIPESTNGPALHTQNIFNARFQKNISGKFSESWQAKGSRVGLTFYNVVLTLAQSMSSGV